MTDAARATYAVYADHADAFDRDRNKSLFERDWLDRFLAYVPPGGHVLDLGCGSAEPIAAYLLDQKRRVTGIDASPAMIALAKDRFPSATWVVGDMRDLTLETSFDGVLGWNSFFHLTRAEQRLALPAMARLLKPGAPLMVTTGTSDGEAMGTVAGAPVYHASLKPDAYRALLEGCDCQVIAHAIEEAACNGHSILLAQKR